MTHTLQYQQQSLLRNDG